MNFPPSPKTKKGKSTVKCVKRKRTKSSCHTTAAKCPKRDTTTTRAQVHLGSSLQAARDRKFGLNTSHPVRENRHSINYAKLNNGIQNEEDPPTPKRRKRGNLPSRSGPSEERIAVSTKSTQSTVTPLHSPPPVSRVTEKPLTVTPVTVNSRLTGVTNVLSVTPLSTSEKQIGVTVTPKSSTSTGAQQILSPGKLPDLVVNTGTHTATSTSTNSVPPEGAVPGELLPNSTKSTVTATQENIQTETNNTASETEIADQNIIQDPQITEDEEDAVDALLSLGSDLSQNISTNDPLNENALLMPIGAPTIQDVNPVEVKLDQVSVDKSIANIIEHEQMLETSDSAQPPSQVPPVNTENNEHADSDSTIPGEEEGQEPTDAKPANADDKPPPIPKKGSVEIKEYGVKRKVSDGKLKFKCPKCGKRTKTRKEQNQHYMDSHDPIMCSDCDKVFSNPASLSVHMYDHMDHRFKCDICG